MKRHENSLFRDRRGLNTETGRSVSKTLGLSKSNPPKNKHNERFGKHELVWQLANILAADTRYRFY